MYFYYLEVVVTNEQKGYAAGLAEYIKEDDRPLFEEDLPVLCQYLTSWNRFLTQKMC